MKETNRKSANVAKRRARQRKLRNRRIALTVCLMLVVMVASIGGTVAWLTAKTDSVVNTFTYGNINIDLYEHEYKADTNTLDTTRTSKANAYKIIPGVDLPKDPTVEVKANSEACWLFVKVEVEGNFASDKVTYSIANEWNAGIGTDGIPTNVYYRQVPATGKDAVTYQVLAGDETNTTGVIHVSDELTKDAIKNLTAPKLKFTAYAVQLEGFAENAAGAWEQAQNAANS